MFVEWMNDHYYLTYPIYTNITAILRAWSPICDFIWQRKEEIKSSQGHIEFAEVPILKKKYTHKHK